MCILLLSFRNNCGFQPQPDFKTKNWNFVGTEKSYEVTITDSYDLNDCKEKSRGKSRGRSIPIVETNSIHVMQEFDSSINVKEVNQTTNNFSGCPKKFTF